MSDLEQFHRLRDRLLVVFAISFVLWQGSSIVADYGPTQGAVRNSAMAVLIPSLLAWFGATVLLFGGSFSRQNKLAQQLAEDEWQTRVSQKTISASYLILVAVLGAIMAWTTMVGSLNADIVIRAVLMVAVALPLLMSPILDRLGTGALNE